MSPPEDSLDTSVPGCCGTGVFAEGNALDRPNLEIQGLGGGIINDNDFDRYRRIALSDHRIQGE